MLNKVVTSSTKNVDENKFSGNTGTEEYVNAASFEDAITATKFGKFNIILLLVSLPASFTTAIDTASMTYASLTAQCDLNLTLADKGILNAVTYGGMLSSAMLWGFLSDVWGRRKLMIFGLVSDFLAIFLSALSQDVILMFVAKFLQGFIVVGPFSVLSAYTAELTMVKYRPVSMLFLGCGLSAGTMVLPLLAWPLLPQNLDFEVLGLKFHSWNIYLLLTGLPALLSGIGFIFMPESPKYLMSCGEKEKALKVFRAVYSLNTGLPECTYPIRNLVDENNIDNSKQEQSTSSKTKSSFVNGLLQVKPLFFPPHAAKMFLVCLVMICSVMSVNLLRLWIPQIFQAIVDYQALHNSTSDLCTMLELIDPHKNETLQECVLNADNSLVYQNGIIISCSAILTYFVAFVIIPYIGKKCMLISTLVAGGASVIAMYFAKGSATTLACFAVFQAAGSVANNVAISITVDLFPTTLRTLAISIGVMVGRAGAAGGNFLFPLLLQMGCEPPFFVVASIFSVGALLSCLFPRTDKLGLK